MDAREYFGDRFFENAEPELEFETFEQWCWRWIHEERVALESVRESLRDRATAVDTPAVPAMPDNMVSNSATREAWAAFYARENIRARIGVHRESNPAPVHRRPRVRELHTVVGDTNPPGWEP